MAKQMLLYRPGKRPRCLTVDQGFDLLWGAWLHDKPSGKGFLCNRKALSKSFGGKYLNEVTVFDYRKHESDRLNGVGFQKVALGSVFHDHGLLHLLYSKVAEWQRDGDRPMGVDLSKLKLPTHFPTAGSKKRRPPKRKVVVRPAEFLAICRHATSRLRRTLEGLVDLGIREGDLAELRITDYNPYTDQVEWIQSKTGKENCIPATARVRKHFTDAKGMGRDFVYDLTNVKKEFEEARALAKVLHVTKRDIRKTSYNAALRLTKDHTVAGMLAGHSSTRTGMEHYALEVRDDLRPVVQHIEKMFRSR
jgi:integrase